MKRYISLLQTFLMITLICSIQIANAQIRINELDARVSNTVELEEIVKDQQGEIRTLQNQLLDLQNQIQTLKSDMEEMAVAMQNEKVNNATNISMVFTEIQETKSQLMTEIQESENRILDHFNERISPYEQVFEISGTDLVIKSSTIDMQAGLVKFESVMSGVTVQVESVISKSYTPGAGNVW